MTASRGEEDAPGELRDSTGVAMRDLCNRLTVSHFGGLDGHRRHAASDHAIDRPRHLTASTASTAFSHCCLRTPPFRWSPRSLTLPVNATPLYKLSFLQERKEPTKPSRPSQHQQRRGFLKTGEPSQAVVRRRAGLPSRDIHATAIASEVRTLTGKGGNSPAHCRHKMKRRNGVRARMAWSLSIERTGDRVREKVSPRGSRIPGRHDDDRPCSGPVAVDSKSLAP